MSETANGFGAQQSLTEMPEKQAVFQISLLPVLEDSKFKAKDIVFVKEKPEFEDKKL